MSLSTSRVAAEERVPSTAAVLGCKSIAPGVSPGIGSSNKILSPRSGRQTSNPLTRSPLSLLAVFSCQQFRPVLESALHSLNSEIYFGRTISMRLAILLAVAIIIIGGIVFLVRRGQVTR